MCKNLKKEIQNQILVIEHMIEQGGKKEEIEEEIKKLNTLLEIYLKDIN